MSLVHAKALFEYTATGTWQKNGYSDIPLHKDDVLTLLDIPDKGWVKVRNEADGRIGYVPNNYIKKIDNPSGSPSVQSDTLAKPPAATPHYGVMPDPATLRATISYPPPSLKSAHPVIPPNPILSNSMPVLPTRSTTPTPPSPTLQPKTISSSTPPRAIQNVTIPPPLANLPPPPILSPITAAPPPSTALPPPVPPFPFLIPPPALDLPPPILFPTLPPPTELTPDDASPIRKSLPDNYTKKAKDSQDSSSPATRPIALSSPNPKKPQEAPIKRVESTKKLTPSKQEFDDSRKGTLVSSMPSVPVVPVLPTVPLVAPEKRKTPPQQPTEAGVPEAEKKKTPTKQDMDVITVAPENQQKKATPPKQDLATAQVPSEVQDVRTSLKPARPKSPVDASLSSSKTENEETPGKETTKPPTAVKRASDEEASVTTPTTTPARQKPIPPPRKSADNFAEEIAEARRQNNNIGSPVNKPENAQSAQLIASMLKQRSDKEKEGAKGSTLPSRRPVIVMSDAPKDRRSIVSSYSPSDKKDKQVGKSIAQSQDEPPTKRKVMDRNLRKSASLLDGGELMLSLQQQLAMEAQTATEKPIRPPKPEPKQDLSEQPTKPIPPPKPNDLEKSAEQEKPPRPPPPKASEPKEERQETEKPARPIPPPRPFPASEPKEEEEIEKPPRPPPLRPSSAPKEEPENEPDEIEEEYYRETTEDSPSIKL